MSHLTLEALARLVDEPPEPGEETHLAACPECRAELTGLRDQKAALAALPRMVPPPDLWPGLRGRLEEEGLVRSGSRRAPRVALRTAAAVALFLTGGAMGYAVRGQTPDTDPAGSVPLAATVEVPASEPPPEASPPEGGDIREVEQAEDYFLAALDRFMAASGTEASDPAARLAALDNIVLTTAEALNEAPADPVINSYYLTAVAQRNAVLRQIAAAGGDPVF